MFLCILWPFSASARLLTGYQEKSQIVEQKPIPQKEEPRIRRRLLTAPVGNISLPQTFQESHVKQTNSEPVDFAADNLSHDKDSKTVTASGNVEISQAGRQLTADYVSYNTATDTVQAKGNIHLTDIDGAVHVADRATLQSKLKTGTVENLESHLPEGGRFRAMTGERTADNKTIMKNAAYTPCDCDEGGDGRPAWQIRADTVTYHEDENRIAYKNARFEAFGVPLLYSPYLSHSDGKAERKSGFLTPTFGFDSELGATITPRYYWDIAPNRDATFGVMTLTDEAPVGLAEYRHRFENAEIILEGSGTYSGRTDSINGQEVAIDDEARGHLFAEGLWNIDRKWRAGFDLELTSDDQYLNQYDFTGKDVLENELYLERFSGRNYSAARAIAFQDVRVQEEQTDQPNVLPEIEAHFVGQPNALMGGRWSLSASALGLERESDGQDMNRFVTEAGWQKRYLTGFGLVSTVDAQVRGDAYTVRDREIATENSGRSTEGSETRGFARLHTVSSLPFVKPFSRGQTLIEPVAGFTLAPNVNAEDDDIPNEDSQDVQLDASSLFVADRFPGKDRIEDRSRGTYGLRTGVYGHGGSHLDAFFGQSYRFEEDDNPFIGGSGLSNQASDVVGQITGRYDDRYIMDYRFQLDSRHLTSTRHEFDGSAEWDRLSLDARYLFAKGLVGTNIDESREQAEGAMAYRFADHWRFRSGALYDLGASPGLRKARFGLDYTGCCLSFSTTATRSLTDDSSGDSGTDITFRVGLKGLGSFATANDGRWGIKR